MEENKVKIRNFLRRFYRKGQISDDDNIFELGLANSLFIIQLASFLEREFKVDTGLLGQDYSALGTINSIAEFIDTQKHTLYSTYTLPNGLTIAHLNKAETDHFYNDIYIHNTYTKNGIDIMDGSCIFDVGANIGMFSLYVASKYRNLKVYAFEPVPPIFSILCTNMEEYKSNVKLFNVGISDAEKDSEITFYTGNAGMSSVYADETQEREVLKAVILNQMNKDITDEKLIDNILDERLKKEIYKCKLRTISDIIDENDIYEIDLLKIDVQKSEMDVLLGIHDKDWKKIKQIVLEVHDLNGRLGLIEKLLNEKGFSVEIEQDELYKQTVMYNLYAVRK